MQELRFIWRKLKVHPYQFGFLWLATLWSFFYITNLGLFNEILNNSQLSGYEKFSFLLESFTNIFRFITDPKVLSVVVFSLIAAINLKLMWAVIKRRQRRGLAGSSVGSGVALIGSHCLACGGSLLAPFITTLAGSGAYFSSARITTAIYLSIVINLVGVVVIGFATVRLARQELIIERSMPNV